jgi:hypothetical protein
VYEAVGKPEPEIDVKSSDRNAYAHAALEQFDLFNTESTETIKIVADPGKAVAESLKTILQPPQVPDGGAPAACDANGTPAIANDERIQVANDARRAQQSASDGDEVMPIGDWYTLLEKAERNEACERDGGDEADAHEHLTFAEMKSLMAQLTHEFEVDKLAPGGTDCNLLVSRLDFKEELGKFKLLMRGAGENSKLPFFGRVVDITMAANLNKNYVLPIGDNLGQGPSLYLDLSAHINPMRSDWCPASVIQKLPLEKDPKAKVLDCKKKAAKPKDPSKQPFATHEVKYDCNIVATIKGKTYTYQKPRLHMVDVPGGDAELAVFYKRLTDVNKEQLYRARMLFDDAELKRIKKKPKVAKCFMNT